MFTKTVTVVDPTQPLGSLPFTVYVVVAAGVAVTVAPVAALNVAAGDHVILVAPVAVNETDSPKQMLGAFGVTEILNPGAMVTVESAEETHPFISVPITVYDCVEATVAVTLAPVVAESPVPGVQV